jgi:hypothetical protein
LPTSRAVPPTGHAWLQRFVVAVVLTAAAALAVVIVPLFALKPGPPSASRAASVTASAGTFSTVPRLSTAQRRELAAGLESFLASLYQRAFTDTHTSAVASPAASPDPIAGVGQLFSPRALDALHAHPDVFVPPDGVRVYDGRVSFDGVATVDSARQTEAFLDITFLGKAQIRGAPVELVQKGSMLLVHTPGGWQVAGFDLTMNAESVHPSPRPSRAMRAAS